MCCSTTRKPSDQRVTIAIRLQRTTARQCPDQFFELCYVVGYHCSQVCTVGDTDSDGKVCLSDMVWSAIGYEPQIYRRCRPLQWCSLKRSAFDSLTLQPGKLLVHSTMWCCNRPLNVSLKKRTFQMKWKAHPVPGVLEARSHQQNETTQ